MLPTTAVTDIASTTTAFVGQYSGVAILVCSVVLGFYVIERLLMLAGGKAIEHYQEEHPIDTE